MDNNKYVTQLVDLKAFVKAEANDATVKVINQKDEQSQRNVMVKRIQKIRDKLDQMTVNLSSQEADSPQCKNSDSDQQRQLQQVKSILTSFLKQAGSQMKTSQEDLDKVIEIINLKAGVIQPSTNSLIIKLWNTILTSVGEFKKTYLTNQLEVNQKLDGMDVKLDAIMSKIEDQKNEVLLELYKMSKVQDMIFDKAQEFNNGLNQFICIKCQSNQSVKQEEEEKNGFDTSRSSGKYLDYPKILDSEEKKRYRNRTPQQERVQFEYAQQEAQQQPPQIQLQVPTTFSALNPEENSPRYHKIEGNQESCSRCKQNSSRDQDSRYSHQFGKYSEKILRCLEQSGNKDACDKIKSFTQTEWKFKEYQECFYEGEFLKGTDIREGYGLEILKKTGDVYEGKFKNSQASGLGQCFFKGSGGRGNHYYGNFFENKRHGFGKYLIILTLFQAITFGVMEEGIMENGLRKKDKAQEFYKSNNKQLFLSALDQPKKFRLGNGLIVSKTGIIF